MSLKIISPQDLDTKGASAVDAETLEIAAKILEAVNQEGDLALRRLGERFGDLSAGDALIISASACAQAFESLTSEEQALLTRTAARIETFALAQRAAITDIKIPIPGGFAGHQVSPVDRAGCYAPGGRFPLPSSVLMTAVTARAAGVEHVFVASPKPTQVTLAAAHVAKADGVLAVGGAQAIAAFAYGTESIAKCDVIVGPGNRFVTAAKKLVSGQVGIDMLAGPSELVVLADDSAPADVIAADLLAQAEHDVDAVPILVTPSRTLADAVVLEVTEQLAVLPTRSTASKAVENGFVVVVSSLEEGIEVCDQLAPEHLEVMTQDAKKVASRCNHYGGLFIGFHAAEVLGDYGAGPNHTLPTGGTARHTGGLSVFDFLRIRTWMEIEDPTAAQELVQDAIDLAHHEGLEGHARSAEKRQRKD